MGKRASGSLDRGPGPISPYWFRRSASFSGDQLAKSFCPVPKLHHSESVIAALMRPMASPLNELSVAHQVNTRKGLRHVRIMRRNDDGLAALCQRSKQVGDHGGIGAVEIPGGLVGQHERSEERRVGKECRS